MYMYVLMRGGAMGVVTNNYYLIYIYIHVHVLMRGWAMDVVTNN